MSAQAVEWVVEGRDEAFRVRVNFYDRSIEFSEMDGEGYFPGGFYAETLEGLIDALEQAREALEA